MSKVILSDVLRNQMHFDGVIITDALDMAGISDYFEPVQAVLETFRAGADMALMPYHIDDANDLLAFKLFIRSIARQLTEQDLAMMQASLVRVNSLRQAFSEETISIEEQVERAETILANDVHRQLEAQAAIEAITVLKGQDQLPWTDLTVKKVKLIAHDLGRGELLKSAILDYWPLNNHQPIEIEVITWYDQILSEPLDEDVVKLGLLDYSYRDRNSKLSREEQRLAKIALVNDLLTKQNKMVLVAMQSPYDLIEHLPATDVALAAYLSTTYLDPDSQQIQGLMYRPLAAVLTGVTKRQGRLPVILDMPEAEAGVASGVQ
jgi:beta-N-acetylhexosaminidase